MTRDDIIRMAREAGFEHYEQFPDNYQSKLLRFATLVSDAEREECMHDCFETVRDAVRVAVEAEREECAKACDSLVGRAEAEKARQRVGYARTANDEESELRAMRHELTVSTYSAGIRRCAAAIRARGEA